MPCMLGLPANDTAASLCENALLILGVFFAFYSHFVQVPC